MKQQLLELKLSFFWSLNNRILFIMESGLGDMEKGKELQMSLFVNLLVEL